MTFLVLFAVLAAAFFWMIRNWARPGEDQPAFANLAQRRFCEFPVAGESHHQQAILAAVEANGFETPFHCEAVLRPEPTNPHDSSAVAVDIGGNHVGFIPRDYSATYVADLARLGLAGRHVRCRAYVNGGPLAGDEPDDPGYYGVKLGLVWPIRLAEAETPGDS